MSGIFPVSQHHSLTVAVNFRSSVWKLLKANEFVVVLQPHSLHLDQFEELGGQFEEIFPRGLKPALFKLTHYRNLGSGVCPESSFQGAGIRRAESRDRGGGIPPPRFWTKVLISIGLAF